MGGELLRDWIRTFELLLDAAQCSRGLNDARVDGQHIGHTLGRAGYVLERDAQIGLALGALYRHAQQEAWRVRTAISTGDVPAWLQQTHSLFLSDGVIEVARRTNPGLYRDLLRRLMKGECRGGAFIATPVELEPVARGAALYLS
ncbi:hypothetical protein E7T06_18420 [Deinococcus sp. Arct2-2]|uniref:hypothetical protein n=1 Tax=Deinococcus sp. Arct2-2 TaxID=2568653 RepID=UPI0010A31BB8|nr:hypothetical protein [Deinococcus sp. Arct2-2]THF68015.1 hypothetical protein E7T06_18420 [Deinococcus sp. Arct2-2]